MTHDKSNPPSDELMAKVAAKWKGWVAYRDIEISHGYTYPHPFASEHVADPRADTNSALELLHYVNRLDERANGLAYITAFKTRWGIVSEEPDGPHEIGSLPISGQPFRNAVCWLVVEVLGVG